MTLKLLIKLIAPYGRSRLNKIRPSSKGLKVTFVVAILMIWLSFAFFLKFHPSNTFFWSNIVLTVASFILFKLIRLIVLRINFLFRFFAIVFKLVFIIPIVIPVLIILIFIVTVQIFVAFDLLRRNRLRIVILTGVIVVLASKTRLLIVNLVGKRLFNLVWVLFSTYNVVKIQGLLVIAWGTIDIIEVSLVTWLGLVLVILISNTRVIVRVWIATSKADSSVYINLFFGARLKVGLVAISNLFFFFLFFQSVAHILKCSRIIVVSGSLHLVCCFQ